MIVISPYTRENYVSSNLTDTTSVVKFIEDNWLNGERIPDSFDAVSGSLDAPGGLLDFNTKPHFQPGHPQPDAPVPSCPAATSGATMA